MEAPQEPPQLGTGWIEFSERHARAASSDFARSVVQYFNSTLQAEARANISHKDLLKKFIDCFSENFEYEYLRRSVQQGNIKVSLPSNSQVRGENPNTRKSHESHGRTGGRRRRKKYGSSLQRKRKTSFFSLLDFSARLFRRHRFTRPVVD